MKSSDDRLLELLDEHLGEVHPEFAKTWRLEPPRGFRLQSPVEPCNVCGQRVYLILRDGCERPYWVRLGRIKSEDTLFPSVAQVRHECGGGESWSVEAALFVDAAMAEWGAS